MYELEEELEELILERICLVQANIKNNTFMLEADGSFSIKLEELDRDISQVKNKINEYYNLK